MESRIIKIFNNIATLVRKTKRTYIIILPLFGQIFIWKRYRVIGYSLSFMLLLSTCKTLYKFVTSSLPKDVKYFYIEPIKCNRAEIQSHTLSEQVYSKLKGRLETIFQQKDKGADISFKGVIMDYKLDTKSKEVSVKISITYIGHENKEEKFDMVKHKKLPDNQEAVQDNVLQEMAEEIVDDIWDKTVAKW